MRNAVAIVAVMAGWFVTSTSRGDVVQSEPPTCPPGGEPATCHGGPHCRLRECVRDADCRAPATCRELDVCVGQLHCGGLIDPSIDANVYLVDTVEGTCPGGCAGTCQRVSACASPEPTGTGGGATGGASSVTGGAPSVTGGMPGTMGGSPNPSTGGTVAPGAPVSPVPDASASQPERSSSSNVFGCSARSYTQSQTATAALPLAALLLAHRRRRRASLALKGAP